MSKAVLKSRRMTIAKCPESRVSCDEEVIGDFNKGCLSAGVETRLILCVKIMVRQVNKQSLHFETHIFVIQQFTLNISSHVHSLNHTTAEFCSC